MNSPQELDSSEDIKKNRENEHFNSNFAKKGIHFVLVEASRVDKELRRFSYKHPLIILTAGLTAGYVTHWVLNKQSSAKNE